MDKITERVQVSITQDDKDILDRLRDIFRQKNYSRVVQILIRYHKNGKL